MIPNAASWHRFEAVPASPPPLEGPYILAVAAQYPHKNLEDAGPRARPRRPGAETGHIDDAALGSWYRGATMFAFASLFEGSGMPPVEALGFGRPTLTTTLTSLPQVTLSHARTVAEPMSPQAWAAAMLEMARDPATYRPSGRQVAGLRAHYAPQRIARLYIDMVAE